MATLGERLRLAVEAWEPGDGRPSVRRFQREMEKRLGERGGRMGVSYPAINSYLQDASKPSLEWIDEAADLLGVRAVWLAYEDGEPTAGREGVRQATEGEDYIGGLLADRLEVEVAEYVLPLARKVFLDVHFADREAARGRGDALPTPEASAEGLVEFLLFPVRRWDIRYVEPARIGEYLTAALHSLRLALPDGDRVRTEYD